MRRGLALIYRQELIQDITLFTSALKAQFYDKLFSNLDLSDFPKSTAKTCRNSYSKRALLCAFIALRTEAERYNSRFKATDQERLWVCDFNAAQNLGTIVHIALLAVASTSVKFKAGFSVRLLKAAKRLA